MAVFLKKNTDYIDLIIHVHILGTYVHVCARYEVSLIKPVAREHYLQTMMQDNNADPQWTIHDCIGSLA